MFRGTNSKNIELRTTIMHVTTNYRCYAMYIFYKILNAWKKPRYSQHQFPNYIFKHHSIFSSKDIYFLKDVFCDIFFIFQCRNTPYILINDISARKEIHIQIFLRVPTSWKLEERFRDVIPNVESPWESTIHIK